MIEPLRDLLEHNLLTLDEAQELQRYVTNSPVTYLEAPEFLRDKVWRGLALLEFEVEGATRH